MKINLILWIEYRTFVKQSKKNRGVTEMFVGAGMVVGGCTLIACFPTTTEKRYSDHMETVSAINAGFVIGGVLSIIGVVTETCGVIHYVGGKEKMRDIALVLSPNSIRFVF